MMNYKSTFTSLLLSLTICGNACAMKRRHNLEDLPRARGKKQLKLDLPQTELTDLPPELALKIAKHILHPANPIGNLFYKQSEKGKVELRSDKKPGAPLNKAWNPTEDRLAKGFDNGEIQIWSKDCDLLHSFKGHNNAVTYLTWNLTGDCLASASLDNTIKIWRKDGLLLNTFEHRGPVRFLRWDKTGNAIASVSADSKLAIFIAKTYEQKIEVLLESIAKQSHSQEDFWKIFFNIVSPKPVPISYCIIS